jgi:hypothetical protein
MLSDTERSKAKHRKGDIIIDAVTNIRRIYDGTRWRRQCSVHMCQKAARMQNLCVRHFKELEDKQKLALNNKSRFHLPINTLPATEQNSGKHKKGDIVINAVTNIRRIYDGAQWRPTCYVPMCEARARLKGLCTRHLTEFEIQQQLPQSDELLKQLSMGDYAMVTSDQNDSINSEMKGLYQSEFA